MKKLMLLLFFLFEVVTPAIAFEKICVDIFERPRGKIHFSSLEQFKDAILNGLIIDFSNPNHLAAFELYRMTYMGDPKTDLYGDQYDSNGQRIRVLPFATIAKELNQFPLLRKQAFTSIRVLKKVGDDQVHSFLIRQLGLSESPLRSCLGGADCSSRTYPLRALDPNYHYFTKTDIFGHSTGQVTIALGTGTLNGKEVKAAFIDKIQFVKIEDLPTMLEGIRLSVLEQGYTLIIPKDLGKADKFSSGISIYSSITNYLKENFERLTESAKEVLSFSTHPHKYKYPMRYSRAGPLPSVAVRPLFSPDLQFHTGPRAYPYRLLDEDGLWLTP